MSLSTNPSISIIMPVRNEGNYIRGALNSILSQDYPLKSIEILVIDGMSTDATRRIVHQIIEENQSTKIYIIDNEQEITPVALNIGLNHAVGDVIIRIDGHCEIAPDYVRECIDHLADPTIGCVGGVMKTINETAIGSAIAVAMSVPFGVGAGSFRTKEQETFTDTVAFPAYRRDVIEKVGYFDETLLRNQDDEYNFRLRKLGYQILLTPKICSRYYGRSSLKKLALQYYQYGLYKVRVFQKHPSQMGLRHFVPAAFVAFLVIGLILFVTSTVWRVWLFLLLIYGMCSLLVTASALFKYRRLYMILLPLIFFILHLAYGLGFWMGLWKFFLRRHEKVSVKSSR